MLESTLGGRETRVGRSSDNTYFTRSLGTRAYGTLNRELSTYGVPSTRSIVILYYYYCCCFLNSYSRTDEFATCSRSLPCGPQQSVAGGQRRKAACDHLAGYTAITRLPRLSRESCCDRYNRTLLYFKLPCASYLREFFLLSLYIVKISSWLSLFFCFCLFDRQLTLFFFRRRLSAYLYGL